jgi:hypothetical protein
MKEHVKIRNILLIIGPLCIGLFIYYSRPLFVPWSVVRNFVPDACWAFSFTYAFFLLWKGTSSFIIKFVPLVLFLGFEFLQKTSVLTGTFDYFDILFYFLAYLLAWLIWFKNEEKKSA